MNTKAGTKKIWTAPRRCQPWLSGACNRCSIPLVSAKSAVIRMTIWRHSIRFYFEVQFLQLKGSGEADGIWSLNPGIAPESAPVPSSPQWRRQAQPQMPSAVRRDQSANSDRPAAPTCARASCTFLANSVVFDSLSNQSQSPRCEGWAARWSIAQSCLFSGFPLELCPSGPKWPHPTVRASWTLGVWMESVCEKLLECARWAEWMLPLGSGMDLVHPGGDSQKEILRPKERKWFVAVILA